jgi:hypothetical protein
MALELDSVIAIARITDRLMGVSSLFAPKEKVNLREEQLKLLQELTKVGIDPTLFDLMLSSELDRALKRQFGIAFFISTIFFTMLSYAVIVANGILHWGISETAITALIVETPIQFIGLLYIIARNLFPHREVLVPFKSKDRTQASPSEQASGPVRKGRKGEVGRRVASSE